MIPFSGLSRFSGLFNGDGPSPLNRDTTVPCFDRVLIVLHSFFSVSASHVDYCH